MCQADTYRRENRIQRIGRHLQNIYQQSIKVNRAHWLAFSEADRLKHPLALYTAKLGFFGKMPRGSMQAATALKSRDQLADR